jgi:hypothetical protein
MLLGPITEQGLELFARFRKRHVNVQQSQAAERTPEVAAHPDVRQMRRMHRDPAHFPNPMPRENQEKQPQLKGEDNQAKAQKTTLPTRELTAFHWWRRSG